MTNIKHAITRNGSVIYEPTTPMTIRLTREETMKYLGAEPIRWEDRDDHCEIAHVEITSDCNRTCPYCYNPKNKKELHFDEMVTVIKNLAAAGVFQLTFGGGEPFCRRGIFRLAAVVKETGMNLCTTTNGDLLASSIRSRFVGDIGLFGQINVSYHGDLLKFLSNLYTIADECKERDVKLGINFCCQNIYVQDIDKIAVAAKATNAELLLLSYKSVTMDIPSYKNLDILCMAIDLANRYKINTAVDGSCVRKCFAARRFVDVHPNGDVSLCSFKREPIGNALREDFRTIWENRPKEVECPFFPGLKNH